MQIHPGLGSPLNSVGYGGLNTSINGDGIAGSGTRIALQFSGIPQGASVQVPQLVYIFPSSTAFNGTYSNGSTGVMILTNTDPAGAGAFSPAATSTLPGNLAVYEVLWADPFATEYAEVPYTLINAPGGTTVQVTAGFAPFYSDAGSQQQDSSYPVPRFLNGANVCGGQSCLNITPDQGLNSGPVQATITNYGTQSLAGAQVLLRGASVPDILGTNMSYSSPSSLTATFDLSGAALGARDLVISPTVGSPLTIPGGFSILQTPACSYAVGPQSSSFPADGGTGNLIVSSNQSECAWSATSGANWITLQPVSAGLPSVQAYTVAANAGSSPRSGSISIAGENIAVIQEGTAACDYSINPGSKIFPVNGGSFTVNVVTKPGCTWSTVSSLAWVSFPNGSSGSGNGSVTIQTGPNGGGLLAGTITIGGQPFLVRQSASACGAIEVTSQVKVTRKALLGQIDSNATWTQQLVVANTGGAVPGPVYVVLDGLCNGIWFSCPFQSVYQLTSCQVPLTWMSSPMVLVAPGGLTQGQTLIYTLQFSRSPYMFLGAFGSGPVSSNSVSTRVLSGTPNQ